MPYRERNGLQRLDPAASKRNRTTPEREECVVRRFLWHVMMSGLMVCVIGVIPAHAQLVTQHIKGVIGLKGGSQPPPHTYVIAPLWYIYDTDTIRTRNGDRLPIDAQITSVALAGGVSVVTTKTLLGGRYGFQILMPVWANNRIQGTEIDANPGGGLSDSAIVPISLGWNFKRADALAMYTVYLPTGRYTDGATDNTGFGMWGHEVGFGTTVYLNEARKYHAATVASFNFQSKKEDSETKVGNAMNLEGGVGADFLEGGLTRRVGVLRLIQADERPHRNKFPDQHRARQGQGLRARSGSVVGACAARCPVRISESELPVGDVRADSDAGE